MQPSEATYSRVLPSVGGALALLSVAFVGFSGWSRFERDSQRQEQLEASVAQLTLTVTVMNEQLGETRKLIDERSQARTTEIGEIRDRVKSLETFAQQALLAFTRDVEALKAEIRSIREGLGLPDPYPYPTNDMAEPRPSPRPRR